MLFRRLPMWLTSAIALCLSGGTAFASSTAAWDEFRRDVEATCREASASQIVEPQIVVDPFGLQSYGLAFITGNSPTDGTRQTLVCVYDKATRTVEIGGAQALESAVSAPRAPVGEETVAASEPEEAPQVANAAETGLPASVSERLLSTGVPVTPAPLDTSQVDGEQAAATTGATPAADADAATFGGRCDPECLSTLALLDAADRAELVGLPAQIRRTIVAGADSALDVRAATVRGAADAAGRVADGASAAITSPSAAFVGSASCTLYYFGFAGEAARTVGTHQCTVSQGEGDDLVFEKTSGERLRAEIRPLVSDVSAFVGRTFEAGAAAQSYDRTDTPEAAATELGNTVGFAAAANDQLVLISSQRRRFDASDSFFWVLAMDRP